MLGQNRPALARRLGLQAVELLRDGLLLGLALGRHSGIHGDVHRAPPSEKTEHSPLRRLLPCRATAGFPTPAAADRLASSVVRPPAACRNCGGPCDCPSSWAPC